MRVLEENRESDSHYDRTNNRAQARAIIRTNRDGRIVRINTEAEKLFGYPNSRLQSLRV